MNKIQIDKDYLNFNSGHFTIFSETSREDLHGHTFYVSAEYECPVDQNGLTFDYNIIKNLLKHLCDEIDEKVLLPELSPFLNIKEENEYIIGEFANEKIPFLPRDVVILPIRNVTLEELAPYFLNRLRNDSQIEKLPIERLQICVSAGHGQSATAIWLPK